EEARTLPSFGLMEAQVGGRDVIISQTGFTGEKGYEIYLKEATKYAGYVERRPRGRRALQPQGRRAQPPPQDRRRHPLLGAGYGFRDLAVPGQPGLPGASEEGGRLHRQDSAGGGAGADRGRVPAVSDPAGRSAGRWQAD